MRKAMDGLRRRRIARVLLTATALVLVAVLQLAQAQDADKKFEVTGALRIRYEHLNNYLDFNNDVDDLFSFLPYRALVGVSGQLADNVQLVIQIQNFGSWGNQSPVRDATFPPFQDFDADGSGSARGRSETSLYQGKVTLNKIGGSDISVTIGRQEYWFGTGLIFGKDEFYNGTVYDGIKSVWEGKDWSGSAFYFKLTERQDPANGQFPHFISSDANMYGVQAQHDIGRTLASTVEAYVIRRADGDPVTFRPSVYTLGGHWWRMVKTAADARQLAFDWNTEIAIQRGSAHDPVMDTRLDIKRGLICSDTVGYNLVAGAALHRVYGSYIRQSGDDNVPDNDIKGWIPLFPAVHGLYGDADFFDANFGQNAASIQALSLGYDLSVNDRKHVFGARLWKFKPVEDRILFAAGGAKEKIEDYGKELDLVYRYAYSKNVTLGVGCAVLKPESGLAGKTGPDDRVNRAWAQADVRF